MVKLASLPNREAEQHLDLSPCWVCAQYLPAAIPRIAATFFLLYSFVVKNVVLSCGEYTKATGWVQSSL